MWEEPRGSLPTALHGSLQRVRGGEHSVFVEMVGQEIVARYRNEGVHGFHDLRTRRSGSEKFIDFHLEVDRNKRFEEAHNLTVKILRAIEAEIPRTKVHIHTDPAG